MDRKGSTKSRFARRLARLANEGALVRLVDARFEDARRDFAKATLARKLAPSSTTAAAQTRAYLRLREVAAEVAR